eukprot:636474-Prymnesium_polylepis.1
MALSPITARFKTQKRDETNQEHTPPCTGTATARPATAVRKERPSASPRMPPGPLGRPEPVETFEYALANTNPATMR